MIHMRKELFVYLSGPMSARDGYTVEENIAAGVKSYLELVRLGVPTYCPHLTGGFPSAWTEVPHDSWIDHAFAVIDRCTHVVMMDRWQSSGGCKREREYAMSIGKPVMDLDQFILAMSVAA